MGGMSSAGRQFPRESERLGEAEATLGPARDVRRVHDRRAVRERIGVRDAEFDQVGTRIGRRPNRGDRGDAVGEPGHQVGDQRRATVDEGGPQAPRDDGHA